MTDVDGPEPQLPRTLADVLREAGIESVGRGGRRRRAEDAPPIASPAGPDRLHSASGARHAVLAEPAADPSQDSDSLGPPRHRRRAQPQGDVANEEEPTRAETPASGPVPDVPSTPNEDSPAPRPPPEPAAPEPAAAPSLRQEPGSRPEPGALPRRRAASARIGQPEQSREPAAARATAIGAVDATTAVPEVVPGPAATRSMSSSMSSHSGVLGWILFVVELAAAAGLGVLIWYAFSLLWELYPYAAAVAAPVVLAGVVLGSQLLRRWRSQEPLGASAIAALLLVAAFLVVMPAAGVLAAG